MSASVVEAGRDDLRAPGALVSRVVREGPDDSDVGVARERKDPVVRQQDRAGCRSQPGEPVVIDLVDETSPALLDLVGRPCSERRDRGGAIEDEIGVQFAGIDGVDHEPIVRPAARRHLEVDTGAGRRHPVVHPAPVGHHEAVESPLECAGSR